MHICQAKVASREGETYQWYCSIGIVGFNVPLDTL